MSSFNRSFSLVGLSWLPGTDGEINSMQNWVYTDSDMSTTLNYLITYLVY
jgi:hypothetical protein